jgi:tetratricopeptide (TPR) repeat protein
MVQAQGPVTTPREPSPAASVSQTVGISTVKVDYSRPSVKSRAIWGALVPYGWNVDGFGAGNSAPWRAGANENTVLTLSHDATIQGHLVPAGHYALFFVINKDNTGEVVLSKDYKAWGSFWYDPKLDEMRANITVRDVPASTERLEYSFNDVTKNSAELDLNWEKKQFPVKIEFAVDQIVMDNATEELKNTAGFGWMGYSTAANYALTHDVNTAQALKWSDQAILINKNYTDLSVKAALLQKTGDSAQAEKVMKDAVAIATEGEVNAYGYQLLGAQKFDKAIEAFKLNTTNHPTSANAWDSEGEGYALAGDKKNAIMCFKKSLSMNPPPLVRANSEKYMKQLSAM